VLSRVKARKSCENWALDLMKIGARSKYRYSSANPNTVQGMTISVTGLPLCQQQEMSDLTQV
jgi:hypothetical protein